MTTTTTATAPTVGAHPSRRPADWNRLAAPLRTRSGMSARGRGPARGPYADAMITFGDRAVAVSPPGLHRPKAWADIGDALRWYDAPEVYAAALATAAELAAGAAPRAPLAAWATLAKATKHTAWVRVRAYSIVNDDADGQWIRRCELPAAADVRVDRNGHLVWLRRWEDVRGLGPDESIRRWDAAGARLAAAAPADALAVLNAAHRAVAAAHKLEAPALVSDLDTWGDVGRILRQVVFMGQLLSGIEKFAAQMSPPVRVPAIARAAAAWGAAPVVLSTADVLAVRP